MKLFDNHFELFNREHWQYAKIKSINIEDVESLKSSFKVGWDYWNKLMDQSYNLINNGKFLSPDSESWNTGYGINSRFWTRFRYTERASSASCISSMINKETLRVYLEWHNHKSDKSTNVIKEHNKWIEFIDDWIEINNVNTKEYRVWTSMENDYKAYKTLEQYLTDYKLKNEYKEILDKSNDAWIRIGKVFPKELVITWDDVENRIADTINELEYLYHTTDLSEGINRRNWLFNVFYSKDPFVWEKCKEFKVAAMQYEEGRQNQSAVTRHLNLTSEISIGDYIIAYTGDKGFLAIGEVTRTFFEESNVEKYINVNEEYWRQRIGVNWFKILDAPVRYTRPDFRNKLGLGNTVMNATIFEIPKIGYEFVEKLIESKTGKNTNKVVDENHEYTFPEFVLSKGYNFNEELLNNYILSLRSKPFTILSGISGTGKTKIAQFFAEFMCPDNEVIIKKPLIENKDKYLCTFEVLPYHLKHKTWVIPQKVANEFPLPEEGNSHLVKVRFDNVEGECRILNEKGEKQRSISFKGEIGKHLTSSYELNDFINVKIEIKDEDESLIVFKGAKTENVQASIKSDRYCFISVRPDWIDNKGLLGYYNPITETYQATDLLKLMLRAERDREQPYFVIFDEMNLAKVEYYFSDFLSCLESRRIGANGKLRSESIKLHDMEPIQYIDNNGIPYLIPSNLEIPENVYFTGTVNIDETTYMFSPKVLDRANVIEFNEINLEEYLSVLKNSAEDKKLNISASKKFINEFTNNSLYHKNLIKKNFNIEEGLIDSYNHVKNINILLKRYNMHFGYRVVDEIMYYLSNNRDTHYFSFDEALDLQILQRILPKLHGNRKKLEQPLTKILCYCFGFEMENLSHDIKLTNSEYKYLEEYFYTETLNENEIMSIFKGKELFLPLTATKVYRMLENLKSNGFASFIE